MRVFRPVVQGFQFFDEKLTRAAMHLMKLRTRAPKPIHPKNLLHAAYESHWFESFLPGPGGTVLDLGAGTGSLSLLAAKRGARVTALEGWDVNLALIESLRAKLPDPALFVAVKHDLEAFPYPIESKAFDLVISHDVIEHLHHRLEHLREAARALKPGGRVVITGPNRATTWKKLRGAVGLSMLADADHKIEYTREEFLAELRAAGFSRIVHESTGVIDAPINGLIDLTAPLSMGLYAQGSRLKSWLGQKWARESTGFRLVLERGES